MEITLKGLTWDHPRGYAPLIAGASEYEKAHPEIRIHWGRRSLRDFGEAPIEQDIHGYDLMVVDHPFVGFAAAHGVLENLAPHLTAAEKRSFETDSVGPSWSSYWYDNGLWALPLDAATQVACYRPDLIEGLNLPVPQSFAEVLTLAGKAQAKGKRIVVAACPTDAISLFFTFSANLGHPIQENADPFVGLAVGREVLQHLHALIEAAHPSSLDWNPIQVYDVMASEPGVVYSPFGFGYTNYSRAGNGVRLRFTDAPAAGRCGSAGTMLGGTGIAVSANSPGKMEALRYARWLASPEHQQGTYFHQGGQPASLAAWTNADLDATVNGFFSGTLRTLQNAYVRPRFDGFVPFFEAAGSQINRCLRRELDDGSLLHWINTAYAKSREKASTMGGKSEESES